MRAGDGDGDRGVGHRMGIGRGMWNETGEEDMGWKGTGARGGRRTRRAGRGMGNGMAMAAQDVWHRMGSGMGT